MQPAKEVVVRRQVCAALLIVGAVVFGLAGTTSSAAATVRFLDGRGNTLEVDPASGRFTFGSTFGSVSGTIAGLTPYKRATFLARSPELVVVGTVDLGRKRANATLVHGRTHRWLTSMRDATVTVPTSPTATPTPAPDAFRVVGESALLADPGRAFQIDAFQNPGVQLRGRFVYRDAAARFSFSSNDITLLQVSSTEARVEGVGTAVNRGQAKFELLLRDGSLPTDPTHFSLKVRGFGYFVDDALRGGRLKLTGRPTDRPTATPTAVPTRVATYTPTRTATPLPTSTPLPTWTPTRVIR